MTTTATDHKLDPTLNRTPARTASLSLARLYLLRFGYAFMGVGLVFVKWPLLVHPPESWSVAQSVVDSILIAMSVLALLGVRYPVRMLPVLLLESLWKLLWLGVVALPAARADDMDAAMADVVFTCSFVVVVLVTIPWRYVWAQFVMAPGDRWR
jgi:hypothetical protein